MDDPTPPDGLRDRLAKSGEDALGKLAQDLLENPLVNGAISRAFEARERAAQAQEVAFGALNIPSAADIERLTRRVRSVSQRLEGIEDGVDRLDEHVTALASTAGLDTRLAAMEASLAQVAEQLEALQSAQALQVAQAEQATKAARAASDAASKPARRAPARRASSSRAKGAKGGGRAKSSKSGGSGSKSGGSGSGGSGSSGSGSSGSGSG